MEARRLFVIAGEASGDLHGANLIRSLRALAGGSLQIHGVGGDRIRQTGVLDFVDLAHCHSTGLTEVFRKIPRYRRLARDILVSIRAARPDAVVLIDNPGFNLVLAGRLRKLGIPVLYYIAPQLWAWAPGRIRKIRERVERVLVVFDFEREIYERARIPVAWVGHPLRDLIPDQDLRLKTPGQAPRVVLLPGSRHAEVRRLLPVFLDAAEVIRRRLPGASFDLVQSPTLGRECYARFLDRAAVPVTLERGASYERIRAAHLALACSGTATLECALLGTPVLVSNRASFLTYLAARAVIRIPYLGLPNIILGRSRFPEFLQFDATGAKIGAEAARLLSDADEYRRTLEDLSEVGRRLGGPGASERAARDILDFLQRTGR